MKETNDYKCRTPILLVAFNRPDNTAKVFERIRRIKPSRLYVAVDGPREGRSEEAMKCKKVHDIVTAVDWNCEVKTLFRDNNLGCKHAVSSAIDWLFGHERVGIILEDDCVPNTSFFKFCDQLLNKYESDERVMTISGDNLQPGRRTTNSYYFSKFMHCWGWATWRRAWKHFDLEMNDWQKLKQNHILAANFKNKKDQDYWEKKFDAVKADRIDSWAYIWQYSIWKKRGINILPEVNLVRNIGFGQEATHTKGKKSNSSEMETYRLSFPLQHPAEIKVHQKADHYTQRNQYRLSFFKKVSKKIKQIVLR